MSSVRYIPRADGNARFDACVVVHARHVGLEEILLDTPAEVPKTSNSGGAGQLIEYLGVDNPVASAKVQDMPRDDPDRQARRAARRDWPIRAYHAGEKPEEGFLADLSVEQRLAIVTDITETCWAVAGKETRAIPRRDWPIKIVRDRRPR